ncbi:MAG TPA: hypothetical protein VMB81_20430 [Candidatus Sulfotelmatobacter sp.]|nr:hypothetical protein [Candidatus Sulfotelmatobacter sp.]
MTRAFRLFLLGLAILLALAYVGPRLGLIGCDELPKFAAGACQVGQPRDQ